MYLISSSLLLFLNRLFWIIDLPARLQGGHQLHLLSIIRDVFLSLYLLTPLRL